MPTCGSPSCSCNRRDRSRKTNRNTENFRYGQAETLRRLAKIPGLVVTFEDGFHWLEMGGFKAPAVILHGCVSIQTDFRSSSSFQRSCIPIRKRRPDGYGLAKAIYTNCVEYATACAQRIHDA